MIRKLQSLETNFSITKAAIIVGVFTLVAKLVALLRDSLLAGKIGPGDTLDTYYAAFRIPDFTFNLLVLGTLSVAFIPVFTEWLMKDKDRAYRIANSVLNISALSIILICAILYAGSRQIAHGLVPGFTDGKFEDTVRLTRLFLLSPIIFTISNVFTSILNSQKKFLVVSLAPIMYNLGIIFGLFFLYPKLGLMGLGFGVIIGAVSHLLVQIPEAVRFGYRWSASVDWKEPVLRQVGRLFLPRILGMDNSQISLLIGTSVGSILVAGSVSVFNFANNLQAVPLGIFAISVATASFPVLSEYYAEGRLEKFADTLASTAMQILFFIVPISVLMMVFRAYIVRLVLGHGKFGWPETVATLNTLGIFTFSLIGQSLSPLFAKSFYARHNTIIPVCTNLSSIILNAVLAYFWGRAYGLTGIASAFALSTTLDALLLFLILHSKLGSRDVIQEFDRKLSIFVYKISIASLGMGLVSYGCIRLFAPLVNTRTTFGIFVQSGLSIGAGLAVFVILTMVTRLEQAQKTLDFFKRILYNKNQ